MIGIFKVNSLKDGGYYIDIYLKEILTKEFEVISFQFSKNKKLSGYSKYFEINYKNPLLMIIKLYQIVNNYKIKICYTNQFISLLYLIILKKFLIKKLKVIAKVDGKTIRKGIKKYFYKIYDFFWDYAKANSDFIIFETNYAKNNFNKIENSVIYTPAINFYELDLEKVKALNLKKQFGDFERFILYVGRFSEEKGYDRVLKIAKFFPDYAFLMIGGMLNIKEKNVFTLGFKNIYEIVKYYKSVDALIVPSRDDSFPNVIREFAYFNKYIISTNVGSIKEYINIGLNIILCDNNKESLINALKGINFNDPKIKNNNLIYKKYFDPNSNAIKNKYIKVFKNFKENDNND